MASDSGILGLGQSQDVTSSRALFKPIFIPALSTNLYTSGALSPFNNAMES
jgi:hypothetical protein